MGKLFEGFKKFYVCTSDFDHILEKSGETIQGGYYSREDTNQGNTVHKSSPYSLAFPSLTK